MASLPATIMAVAATAALLALVPLRSCPGADAGADTDALAARALMRLEASGPVYDVAVGPDGTIIATATTRGAVHLWRASDGTLASSLRAEAPATSVEFSADGTRLAATYSDGTVRLWDPRDGTMLRRMLVHPRGVRAAALSPDGRILAGGGPDGAINLADADTERPLRRFIPAPEAGPEPQITRAPAVRSLAFSPDGAVLVSAHERPDPFVHVWDPQSGREIARLAEDGDGVHAIVFSPDGATLATASDTGRTVTLWETATWRIRRKLNCGGGGESPHAFSADGRGLWTVNNNSEVWRWDLATGRRLAKLAREHRSRVNTVAAFPAGTRIVSAGEDGDAVVWSGSYTRPEKPPRDVEVRPEGLWGALAAEDAAAAYDAVWALVAAPEQAVPYLRNRIPRGVKVDAERVRRLLADLDHDRFTVREGATRELAQLGGAAESLLREQLAAPASPEVRQRIEVLLESVARGVADADMLRAARAIEVLERIGTPEAAAALRELADGTSGSTLRNRAAAAVDRLDRLKANGADQPNQPNPAERP